MDSAPSLRTGHDGGSLVIVRCLNGVLEAWDEQTAIEYLIDHGGSLLVPGEEIAFVVNDEGHVTILCSVCSPVVPMLKGRPIGRG